MPSRAAHPGPRRTRRVRWTRPCVLELEPRVVLSQSQSIPGLAGVTRGYAGRYLRELQQHFRSIVKPEESIAEFDLNYDLIDGAVFTESGASAAAGDLHGHFVRLAPRTSPPATFSSSSPTVSSSASPPAAQHRQQRMIILPHIRPATRVFTTFKQAPTLT